MADGTDESPAARTVNVAVREGVATLTLNRAERRNAISWNMITGLIDALDQVKSNSDVRAVVLTGAGRAFCVGADLDRVGSGEASDQESRTLRGRSIEDDQERLSRASVVTEMLLTFPKPTVAKINGACAGAGLSLALAADISVAACHAKFNTAFVSAGVSGDFGSAWLLSRAVGEARARALLLAPEKMTAAQAAAVGMVTEVAEDVDARVAELARKLSTQAPLAMSYAKQNVLDAGTRGLSEYLRAEVPRMVDSAHSEDARTAARAFVAARRASQ